MLNACFVPIFQKPVGTSTTSDVPTFLGPKGKVVGEFPKQNKWGDLKIPTKVPFPFGTLKGRGCKFWKAS